MRACTEEEFLHLPFEKLGRLGLNRRTAVLVAQHRLMLQPACPARLGNVLENALAELAGVRRPVEPGGFPLQDCTLNHPGHVNSSSSNLIGAGRPSGAGSRALYQTVLA